MAQALGAAIMPATSNTFIPANGPPGLATIGVMAARANLVIRV